MFARTNQGNRGKGLHRSALLVVWIAAGLACATTPAPPSAQGPGALSDVVVETDGDATVVSLVGLTEPVYNSFQQEDPARVVIDLAGVTPGEVARAIAVYDGTIDEVTVAGFDNQGASSTRIELSLATVASYEVSAVEDRLEIRILAQDGLDTMGPEDSLAATDEPAEDAWETVAAAEPAADAEPADDTGSWVATETPSAEVATEPVVPATVLYGVKTESQVGALAATLEADGTIEGATWFTLEDPARLVVDLPGIGSQVTESNVEVGNAWVEKLRIGAHDDKVRVVLDGTGDADFSGVQLVAIPTGLWIGLGAASAPVTDVAASSQEVDEAAGEEMASDETEAAEAWIDEAEATASTATAGEEMATEVADTAPAATETAEAWTDEAETAEAEEAGQETMSVYGVQLETQGTVDRVVIVTEGPAEYVTSNPAKDTTVVRIKGATIDPDANVRVAPERPGAVSLITAFQQPEANEPEVRVVVRGQDGLKPTVSQEGALLYLDFPQKAGQAVASLPVLEGDGGMGAHPAALDPNSDSVEILTEGGLVDGKAYSGRRISLDFKDVEIDDVLRLIAEVSDLNIIAGDEVNGKVTIRLVDVPWDQALDVILLTRGLGFVRVGSVLRIAPSELLKAEEEARLQERRAKEKLEDLVVKLQPVNYADVEEIEKMIKRLLTPRGSVDVDERTNTVILKDIASVIDEATALIKAIDTQTPQVMIEAKIVEANLDFGKELGATWAFGVQPLNNGFDDASGDRTTERLGLGNDVVFHDNPLLLNGITETFNHVQVSNPISSVPTGLLDLGAFILDERLNVEARIEAAESYGEGKVISSPRIVTLDNRKASIEQGVSIPFQTFENGDAKLEFIDAVLRLDVTPHITADKSIIMKLEIQRNAPDDSVQTPTGSPAIAKNEAETETLVKDGQTLVIGGIYIVDQSEGESRVPYFHKIPLLGNAFKNNEVRDIRKELLVFVTPRIVVNPELGS